MASTEWRLLFEKDAAQETSGKKKDVAPSGPELTRILGEVFYPYTYPVIAGPGSLVTMPTLTARAASYSLTRKAKAHGGYAFAAIVLSIGVFACYGAMATPLRFSPSTARDPAGDRVYSAVYWNATCIGGFPAVAATYLGC